MSRSTAVALASRLARLAKRGADTLRADSEAWLCRNRLHPRMVEDHRFPRRPLLRHETTTGTYYIPADANRDCVAAAVRRGEVFEPEVVEVVRQHAAPGSVVLDVGANLGQMAILFSQMVGPTGQVVAFEADDYLFSILKRNIDANRCHNVRAEFAAVFDVSGKRLPYPNADFERFSSYGSYGLDLRAETGRTVQTLAIDDMEFDKPISFMKVDIQGSDLFAMRGARRTIAEHRMPILFEYEEQFQEEFSTSFQQYMDFVGEIGYRVERTVRAINFLIVPR